MAKKKDQATAWFTVTLRLQFPADWTGEGVETHVMDMIDAVQRGSTMELVRGAWTDSTCRSVIKDNDA